MHSSQCCESEMCFIGHICLILPTHSNSLVLDLLKPEEGEDERVRIHELKSLVVSVLA